MNSGRPFSKCHQIPHHLEADPNSNSRRGLTAVTIPKERVLELQHYRPLRWSNVEVCSDGTKELKRSSDVIDRFVKNPQQYGRKKHTGRKPKISPRMQRRIISRSSNSTMSINKFGLI
uniref:Uncharacterized protein n=1 Tax=Ditylenchus dipsaci TaxID=166011 RepID=A0A915EK60_9BILA